MQTHWTQFEAWLAEHWPEGLAGLNPPATDQEIADLEQALGVVLPPDYVACLKVHNGQRADFYGGMFDGQEFLSTAGVLAQWKVWKGLLGEFVGLTSEPGPGIKDDWYNPAWIPFTHNGGGDHLCLDLDPAEGGTRGQIITMWHDAGERDLCAPSFAAWFSAYVDAVLQGQYVYSDDYGGLVDAADA